MQLSPEELQNLSSLLLSTDDTNTQLAFEIIDAQSFPKELYTEAFVVFKLSDNDELKRKAASFLYQQGSANITPIMSSNLQLSKRGQVVPSEKTIKKNIATYVDMSQGELDGMKMALAMYNKYGVGLNYLLSNLEHDLKMNLLKTFIQGSSFKINNCALSKIPTEIYEFKDLTEIDLSFNKLTTIPAQIKTFQKLESLQVSNNIIKKINPALANIPNLKRLDISNNKFKEFPKVICKLQQLEYLNIETLNHLLLGENIPIPKEFANLKNMKEIRSCGGNYGYSQGLGINLKDYPNFKTVVSKNDQSLDLDPLAMAQFAYEQNGKSEGVLYLFKHSKDSDLIKKIIEEQFYFPKEKTLDIKSTMLLNFPKEIADYDIQYLDLAHAFLGIEHYVSGTKNTYRQWALINQEEIDVRFENLAQLEDIKSIDLSENRLAHIPTVLWKWKGLQVLNLHNNVLKEIPDTLLDFTELEELHLSHNQLKILPKDLSALSKLKKLHLGSNQFNEIPAAIATLPNLEFLSLNQVILDYHADIQFPKAFKQLKKLKKIHFYHSKFDGYSDEDKAIKPQIEAQLKALLPKDCEIDLSRGY